MTETFYKILDVQPTATIGEIKSAYRKLQLKYHPDRNQNNPDAVNMTQKINEAYETLGDEQKRAEYDARINSPFGSNIHMNMPPNMNSFFEAMFSNSMPQGTKVHFFNGGPINFPQSISKPIPIIKNLIVTIQQVLTGASLPLEIERWILVDNVKQFEKETIYVDIPQGIDDNEMIVVRNVGNIISETSKGDLKITIQVKNDTQFKRSGLDLMYEKTITLKESICGFSFELHHINGKNYTLNNTRGNVILSGYKKVYPNIGITRGEHKGNLIILFNIQPPEKLTDEQLDILTNIL